MARRRASKPRSDAVWGFGFIALAIAYGAVMSQADVIARLFAG